MFGQTVVRAACSFGRLVRWPVGLGRDDLEEGLRLCREVEPATVEQLLRFFTKRSR